MKPWQRNTLGSVLAGAILGVGTVVFQFGSGWIANANESHDTTETEEPEQTEIKQLVERLGQIHVAEDAAIAQTIKLCEADEIASCRTCRAVGVHDTKACKKLDAKSSD